MLFFLADWTGWAWLIEETDAAEQQKVKCPRSGSVSGEAAMSEGDGE